MFKYFKLSVPILLAALSEPIAAIVDTALVGHLGTVELASMAVAVVLLSTFGWIFNFLVHRPTSNISRLIGEGKVTEVAISIRISIAAAFLISFTSASILFLTRFPLFEFTGASRELIGLGVPYFEARLLGYPFFILFLTLCAVTRGLGNTTFPLVSVLTLTIINISGSVLSIHVFKTGLVGVGLATSASFFVAFLMQFIWVLRECKRKGIDLTGKSPMDFSSVAEFGKDSVFIFLRTAFLTFSIYACTPVVAKFGNAYLAAYQIIAELWLFGSILIDGYGTLGNMKAAELLGRRDFLEYKKVLKSLLGLALITSSLLASAVWFGQEILFQAFTSDPEVIKVLSSVFIVVCLAFITQSIPDVCDGLLYGSSQFRFAGFMMFAGVVLIFIPVLSYAHINQAFVGVLLARALLAVYRGAMGIWRLNSYGSRV